MDQVKHEVSFGIVADVQHCDAPQYKNRYFRNSKEKLRKAIEEFNRHNLDFLINLGDVIDHEWQSYNQILPLFKHINAPVYHVLGNHDYEVEDKYKPMVRNFLGAPRYYTYSIATWKFIVLDGNEISTFANIENSVNFKKGKKLLKKLARENKINANFWNGGLGENQLEWLNQRLVESEEQNQSTIIFCHFPIYPQGRHNLLNDLELLRVIKKYNCVKVWFSGHNHRGNYGLNHDVHFINLKGMVETDFESAFCIAQLSEKQIKIKGFGIEMSARLCI